jgi:hypothetical protein
MAPVITKHESLLPERCMGSNAQGCATAAEHTSSLVLMELTEAITRTVDCMIDVRHAEENGLTVRGS